LGKDAACVCEDVQRNVTDEEIDGMLAFYQSPAGRAMLEKMPQSLQR